MPSHEAGELPPLQPPLAPHSPASLSPSLRERSASDEPSSAFELKFLVTEGVAAQIEEWARAHLEVDPHGETPGSGRYRTTTLYLDTHDLAVFSRSETMQHKKHRVRRYDACGHIFLEEKFRRRDRVRKLRVRAEAGWRNRLAMSAKVASGSASRDDFERAVCDLGLVPTCVLSYERTAFFARDPNRPSRLTLDRNVMGQRTREWSFDAEGDPVAPFVGRAICELKFDDSMPSMFKHLIAHFGLVLSSASKYRATMSRLLGRFDEDAPSNRR